MSPVIFGGLVGMLPDADIVSRLFGEWAMHVHHRGITHSFFAMPVLAALAAWVGWRCDGRRSSRCYWFALAMLALLSHSLLDAFTSYGTILLAPFWWKRVSLDGIAIIDLFYTLPLVAASVAVCVPRWSGRTRAISTVALALTTVYLLAGWAGSARAAAIGRVDLARKGFRAEAVRALPVIAFPTVRRVVGRDAEGGLAVTNYSLLTGARTRTLRMANPSGPLAEAALASEPGRIFGWFADGFIHVETDLDERTLLIRDARYGMISRPEWSPFRAVLAFDAKGRLVSAELDSGGREGFDFRTEFAETWRLAFVRERQAVRSE